MRPTKIGKILGSATVWSGLTLAAFGADVRVIANPNVRASTLSTDELKSIFLETKTSLSDGSHVEPVVLRSGDVHHAFVSQFLGKTDAALETYYRTLVFTGRGLMPKALASDDEMVRYVAKTKGAVGYVSATAPVTGVKIVAIK